MNPEFTQPFAKDWIAAWNAHDLERILAFCSDDFTMTSPKIITIANDPSGTLQGKAAVREYWGAGLRKYPELYFDLISVLAGVGSVTLYYNNQMVPSAPGVLSAEVLHFNAEQKVHRGFAHYAV